MKRDSKGRFEKVGKKAKDEVVIRWKTMVNSVCRASRKDVWKPGTKTGYRKSKAADICFVMGGHSGKSFVFDIRGKALCDIDCKENTYWYLLAITGVDNGKPWIIGLHDGQGGFDNMNEYKENQLEDESGEFRLNCFTGDNEDVVMFTNPSSILENLKNKLCTSMRIEQEYDGKTQLVCVDYEPEKSKSQQVKELPKAFSSEWERKWESKEELAINTNDGNPKFKIGDKVRVKGYGTGVIEYVKESISIEEPVVKYWYVVSFGTYCQNFWQYALEKVEDWMLENSYYEKSCTHNDMVENNDPKCANCGYIYNKENK